MNKSEDMNVQLNHDREDRRAAWKAFGLFQSKRIKVQKKESVKDKGGKVTYKYAKLEDIIDAVMPMLTECGLAFTQSCQGDHNSEITTKIIHSPTGFVLDQATANGPVEPMINSSGYKLQNYGQAYGSITTFFKKYQLAGLLGIATTDDEILDLDVFGDQNGHDPLSVSLKQQIMDHVFNGRYAPEKLQKAFQHFKVEGLDQLNVDRLQYIVSRINKKLLTKDSVSAEDEESNSEQPELEGK